MTESDFFETLDDHGWAEVTVLHDPDAVPQACPICAEVYPDTGPNNVFQHIVRQHPDTAAGQMLRGAL